MTERAERTGWPPEHLLLAAVIVAGAALRLFHLGTPSLWWDEANTMHYAGWVTDLDKIFNTAYLNEAPLMPLLTAGWNGLFNLVSERPLTDPLRDWWLRLLPWMASVAGMPLLYLVVKRLTQSARAGVAAVVLMAFSPYMVHYGQELRVYSVHALTGLAAAYCMLRALKGGRWPWWLGMVVCEALLFYGHYVSVWIIFCFSVFFVLQWDLVRANLLRWTAWHLLMMVLIAPGLWHAWQCNQQLLGIEIAWYPRPGLKSLYITFKNFFAGYGPSAWAYKPLTLTMGALCALGAWRLRRNWRALSFLVVLGAGPVLLNFFMWRARDFSLYEDRLFIFSAAVTMGLAGAGVMGAVRGRDEVKERRDEVGAGDGAPPVSGQPWLFHAVLVLLAWVMAPGLRDYFQGALHPQREHRLAICDKVDVRSTAAFLNEAWREGDLLAHESMFTFFPMHYYLRREQAHLGATPEDYAIYARAFGNVAQIESLGAMPVLAEEAVRGRKRVWYVEAHGVVEDAAPQTQHIRAWLQERYDAAERHEFDGVSLVLFIRKGSV